METKSNQNESFKNESKLNPSILKQIDEINLNSLVSRSVGTQSIWRKEIFANFKNEKTARRKLRNEQLNLAKKVIHSFKVKQGLNEAIANLKKFSIENLQDIANYSNVSADSSPEKRKVLDIAYSLTK